MQRRGQALGKDAPLMGRKRG
ncbi:MAG: hypothetical protein RL472_2192, partial [Pseudomonadota bacterium]